MFRQQLIPSPREGFANNIERSVSIALSVCEADQGSSLYARSAISTVRYSIEAMRGEWREADTFGSEAKSLGSASCQGGHSNTEVSKLRTLAHGCGELLSTVEDEVDPETKRVVPVMSCFCRPFKITEQSLRNWLHVAENANGVLWYVTTRFPLLCTHCSLPLPEGS